MPSRIDRDDHPSGHDGGPPPRGKVQGDRQHQHARRRQGAMPDDADPQPASMITRSEPPEIRSPGLSVGSVAGGC